MPIGVIVNACSVLFGGLIGAFLGDKIPERLRLALPLTFGAASMGMGVIYTVKLKVLPAVILALILGSAIGELIRLEEKIGKWAQSARGPIEKLFSGKKTSAAQVEVAATSDNQNAFMEKFVGILILFCASGTGIFGALNEGMTGDHSILLTKSILDFFTAGIFATSLGYLVGFICIPQIIILMALFFGATFILPMTTPALIADFTSLGGMIMLATGLRISGIKAFPVANMIPGLILVMPISHLWTTFIH
ncbi:DUF554 domain-containing protein [Clostridium magnum]|uniref:Putative membrane protein YdfK n=1 Tax=Clostridium magnum DSM 2767 TaxID=1121326 RepID=A0A162SX84_9CLOT|nr:DUF554 domain-containing protein [Clostridium magnum]KZL91983.1 putative membrane protein YdfK [Clostridium magnum DSM 2767]SHH27268.1 hypothetical protein SAMN02745944_00445 [Clostridium magnum DSM 2767]